MADDHGLDLGPAFREALIAATPISSLLALYAAEPAVFTRRPIPDEAAYPLIIVNSPSGVGDADGLVAERPIWMGALAIYGHKAAPGDASDQTRTVERIGFAVRQLFHRKKWALSVGGFNVIDIRASGPVPAPVDDDKTIGRIVSLIVRLGRN